MTAIRGLVTRVGGPERVRAILERFYARLAADPMVGFFFAGHDLGAIADGQLAFLMKATGLDPGRPFEHPRVAHRALPPILRGQFDRRLRILEDTLVDEGVDGDDIAAWLALEESMRKVVQRADRPRG